MLSNTKRFYWLKLKDDFFRQKEIKQLRRIAGGDTFVIIYLKMLLRSLNADGRLYFEGFEDTFANELALDIDEDVENVKVTVAYLMSKGILVQCSEEEYQLLTADEMTGSEGESAQRMRRMRAVNLLASHSDGDVTARDVEKREKRKEKEIDIELEKDFAAFWSVYPRKVNKTTAVKAWKSLKPNDSTVDEIIADVTRRLRKEWRGKDMTYIPHPSTYLNQRRWEDETEVTEIARPTEPTNEDILASLSPEELAAIDAINARGENFG